ncbi:LOW QUALITY PROTEIN: isoleucine--tRNA ligase, mitochondrial-like [Babylonia areolata]|uniref:LOW QUALITY PROTEIN: isoleucine--tRNA ligase, mitochondrial-like n=1 Tax=Babylonia areolata TaxID=304850 RepID=UPI003FD5BD3E
MNVQKILSCGHGALHMSVRFRSKFWTFILPFLGSKSKKPVAKKSKRYADTLCLPKTSFPLSVKDGLAPKREQEIQGTARFLELYAWQATQPREKVFCLHDGPPYANGKTHVGHAINKILKDITNRYKLLRGYRVHYVPGWDCHGMPIEIKALADARGKGQHSDLTPIQIREKARRCAMEAMRDQMESFKQWGVMADWSSVYTTLSPQYESAQLDIFYKIYEKGLIYRGYMPVYWSPSSRTALAEAELEYNPDHKSTAVYVKFPISYLPESLVEVIGDVCAEDCPVSALVWTTTPWTLPFNQAICFSDSLVYTFLKDKDSSEVFLCEDGFVSEMFGSEVEILGKVEGSGLKGAKYTHPISEKELPFLPGSHVTAGKGTGLVHTAPAHGHDDFQIALKYKLPVDCGVDGVGRYMDHAVDERLRGRKVGRDADEAVLEVLGDHVVKKEDYVHSYPYDWRTKKPIIIRASKQWFVDTHQLKEEALACLREVRIIPRQSEHGMTQQLQTRPYWCISRQRVWGLPIPVFYHRQSGEPLLTRETVDHLRDVFCQQGTDAWWTLPIEQLLPPHLVTEGTPKDYVKGEDILDIWFDSGSSWASVLKDEGGQADMYLEGQDQFGGWFQTSLLTSVAVQHRAPYRMLMVHGFATDEEGKKMSKSLGNVVDPERVVNGGKDKQKEPAYGVEVLRWWVAHSHAHSNIMIGPNILKQFSEALFKVRKCMRYLLGNLHDFDPVDDLLPYDSLLPQDQYMLHLLYEFGTQVDTFYDDYSYSKVLQSLERFVNTSLSSFYISTTKDRCYCSEKDSVERRSCQTTQYHVLKTLNVAAAPILPHLAEEVHAHLPPRAKQTDTLFQGGWLDLQEEWHNPDLKNRIVPIFAIKDSIADALTSESPSEFSVIIYASPLLSKYLSDLQAEKTSNQSTLCELLGVSHSTVLDVPPDVIPDDCMFVSGSIVIDVRDDTGKMVTVDDDYKLMIIVSECYLCERCRRYTSQSPTSPCERCLHALASSWES